MFGDDPFQPSQAEQEAKVKLATQNDELAEFDLDPMERRYMGPLMRYMTTKRLEGVKEVVINHPGEVGYEYADGHWEFLDAPELTQNQLDDASRMIANRFGQIYSPDHPILSVKMPQGHRVQIVSGDRSTTGFSMTIRVQRDEIFSIKDYGLSEEDQSEIISYIKNKKTILISGGTGSGKTSFMNSVLPYIPDDERLLTMEDVPELKVPHRNHVGLLFEAGKDANAAVMATAELINSALRMRPDRILLGEIRKENAFAFCTAINTGHEGSMATIHANNPDVALDAVVNRVLMNGDVPESAINVLRRQLTSDIKAVVQLNRIHGGVRGYFKKLDNE